MAKQFWFVSDPIDDPSRFEPMDAFILKFTNCQNTKELFSIDKNGFYEHCKFMYRKKSENECDDSQLNIKV